MSPHPVLIDGRWRPSQASHSFRPDNPATCQPLGDEYPVSTWSDCDDALAAAQQAFRAMRDLPPERIAAFLETYASRIEEQAAALAEMAHAETALPRTPRLLQVEVPRTTDQLRQAAAAARDESWRLATIDTRAGIRSQLAGIGPVCVFGPNNFPFAFGSASGGDFAAAVAAGNPVIAKANTSHPGTTRLLAEQARIAAERTRMPPGIVQLIYRTSHADGERLVSDPRIGATGYTGSRGAGLQLKAAADAAGKPIYLELSSVNPVVILPGALRERLTDIAGELVTSCLMGTGQFCTRPGLVLLLAASESDALIGAVADAFTAAPVGTLLSRGVAEALHDDLASKTAAGARVVVGHKEGGGAGYSYANTLLLASGGEFLESPGAMQAEAFGNASLIVTCGDVDQLAQVIDTLDGNLTGSVYSHTDGSDDEAAERVAVHLRPRVGRLLNDKMPTGVTVSAAMNHGGPYPATGHPGFTAVGIPAALRRFAALHCYDAVRPHRLPATLRDEAPNPRMWRAVDGAWRRG